MVDANPIRTLGDYSKPSHEGYKNTIELPEGNNVDFLKLVDSLDLDGANRERTRLRLFQFSLRDQASNWLERLPAGSISTWEDLTTRFLAQFFPPGRTAKLRNDILMFQQHQGESLSEAWTRFKDLLQKVPHHGIDRWLQIQIFYDHINFLLKGSRPTPRPSSTHTPQAYADAVYSNPHPQNQNEPPKQKSFTFHERTGPNPQPQALRTSFEARVRDYMAAHTERMERFENAIFKQREEINDRMAEMFGLLKELTTSRAPKKVLIREEAKYPVTKNVNSISLTRGEEEKNDENNVTTVNDIEKTNGSDTEMPVKKAEKENEAENGTKNEPIKRAEREEVVEAPSSQPVGYYLKHRINEKLIEGLVDNHRFNDSLSGVRVGKMKGKTYNLLPRGPVYEAILKKKITRKEDIGGNFEIPCNIGGLKHMNALVDQGSDVNIMPLSTYMKLTDERPAETDIRLSLASHSYIYPLGIAEDVLVDVAGYVYPVDFMILDIREDEKRPFILGTPFLTTAKAVIKFDKGTITLRSGKSKISFHRIPESLGKVEKGIKNDIEPIAPTMTVNRLVLEWEERIKLHQEKEMEFDQWRSKNFKNKHPALVEVKGEKNEGEVTKFFKENKNKILSEAGDGVRIYPDGVIFDEKKLGSS
ncbi:zinc finger, CCHC-type containing protein [Tanacetum coccineum]